ncbi:MAG TPA: YggS family pyridoxal phosphate-dependent enzyme [Chthoniobacteraceae bacterium]|nr:YggS family pyridoxal phosphate-dependent enzyme [Chthoniobacteraceae bacterium]
MPSITENLAAVHEVVAEAARRAGRDPESIDLVAVSKTHAPELVHEALEAGQTIFGESRVQEARAKIPFLPGRARWHFIGHLQKNKIRQALPLFELFHGIDTLELARELNRLAGEAGTFPKALLEVNVAGEASKFGFSPEKVRAQMEELLALDRVQIHGLMTIAPFATEAEPSRRYFAALRELRDALESEFRMPLPQLSMGMSGDYAVAIEEGATLVRIGTAIFGSRRGKGWRPAVESGTFDD